MDSLVVASADEDDSARKLRITLSTAFDDAASPYVRCFINKLKYGVTYSDYIERKIKRLQKEFDESTWKELQRNYKSNSQLINDTIGKVDTIISELVDINIREPTPETEQLPEITVTPKISTPKQEKKEVIEKPSLEQSSEEKSAEIEESEEAESEEAEESEEEEAEEESEEEEER